MRLGVAAGLAMAAVLAVAAAREGERVLSFAPQGSALAHEELPFYSHGDLRPRWDSWSRRQTVGRVALTGADGAAFDQRVFGEGPTVVAFFWTGCASVCPTNLDLLKPLTGARVLLVSDQPLIDTPAGLAAFQTGRGLPAAWRLATGAPAAVFAWAREELFIDVKRLNPDGTPAHQEVNFLIDRQGRLRGVYDANAAADAARLQDDIRRLRAEPIA